MNIVIADPPNIDAIDAVFAVKGRKGVIFTWGGTIYNPSGVEISPSLKAHEGVHYNRQTADPAKIQAWWDKYLVDPEFRLAEEIPAHRAEFKSFCVHQRHSTVRSHALHQMADRLAGPLYGGLISAEKARRLIAA